MKLKPNPLLIVSLVFAASFSGRAVSLAGATTQALDGRASEVLHGDASKKAPEEKKAPVADVEHAAHDAAPGPAASNEAPILPDADQKALLVSIRERAAMLDQREADFAERARQLEVLEKRIEEKTEQLAAFKAELESRLSFAETAAQKDIAQLARMYESMKPQRAGEIFNAMDPSFAAGFLTEMNSESAALILSSMETEKAYAASVIIAGRNAKATAQ